MRTVLWTVRIPLSGCLLGPLLPVDIVSAVLLLVEALNLCRHIDRAGGFSVDGDNEKVPEHDIDELAISPTNGSIGRRAIKFSRIVHIQEDLDVIVLRLIESACKHFAPQGFVDVVHHNRLRTAPDGNEQHLLTALSVFIRH